MATLLKWLNKVAQMICQSLKTFIFVCWVHGLMLSGCSKRNWTFKLCSAFRFCIFLRQCGYSILVVPSHVQEVSKCRSGRLLFQDTISPYQEKNCTDRKYSVSMISQTASVFPWKMACVLKKNLERKKFILYRCLFSDWRTNMQTYVYTNQTLKEGNTDLQQFLLLQVKCPLVLLFFF